MKVEHSNNDKLIQNRTDAAASVERSQQRDVERSGDERIKKDEAALSDKAQILARARSKVDEVPDVRAEKVDRIRDQIEAGSYDVDVDKLAESLIDRLGLG